MVDQHKLDHSQPALLIANHPASFLDAMVLAVFLKRPVYFYVRGDIFKHPLVYKIFTMLHMIPIFNQGDGMANLSKNQQTFERGRGILSTGKLLLVFPEGFSRLSKELAPFKKGAARVALQAAFEDPKAVDLHIQSIAINYSSHALGANLFIRVGERRDITSYQQLYMEFPAKAINKLTMDMFELFHNNVIHVKQGDRTAVVEEVMRMLYNNVGFKSHEFFQRSRDLCTEVSMMSEDEFSQYELLLSEQKRQLNMYRLTDKALTTQSTIKNSLLWYTVCMFPLFIVGLIIWWIPGKISKWIADNTVTREDFYTSVHCGVSGVFGFIWWTVISIVALIYSNTFISMLILSSPFFAYTALRWQEQADLLLTLMRLRKIDSVVIDELKSRRSKILTQ